MSSWQDGLDRALEGNNQVFVFVGVNNGWGRRRRALEKTCAGEGGTVPTALVAADEESVGSTRRERGAKLGGETLSLCRWPVFV